MFLEGVIVQPVLRHDHRGHIAATQSAAENFARLSTSAISGTIRTRRQRLSVLLIMSSCSGEMRGRASHLLDFDLQKR